MKLGKILCSVFLFDFLARLASRVSFDFPRKIEGDSTRKVALTVHKTQ